MSVGFEALPRQRALAKWLVFLPCVFVPVYLCASCWRWCVYECVCEFPTFISIRRMHTLADYGSVHACVKRIQNLVKKKKKNTKRKGEHVFLFFFPLGHEVRNLEK